MLMCMVLETRSIQHVNISDNDKEKSVAQIPIFPGFCVADGTHEGKADHIIYFQSTRLYIKLSIGSIG